MPDTPVAPHEGAPYDPAMEARVSRLEEDMRDVKAGWSRMEATLVRVEALLEATLPHLATKAQLAELSAELRAELAEKPSKTYLWAVMGVLITAILGSFAAGLAAISVLR